MNLYNLSSCGQSRCDLEQVVGNDAPPNPAFEAIFAVVEAPIQAIGAFEDTDPSFDAMMVTTTTPEPTLSFMLFSLSRAMPGLGKDNSPDTHFLGLYLII